MLKASLSQRGGTRRGRRPPAEPGGYRLAAPPDSMAIFRHGHSFPGPPGSPRRTRPRDSVGSSGRGRPVDSSGFPSARRRTGPWRVARSGTRQPKALKNEGKLADAVDRPRGGSGRPSRLRLGPLGPRRLVHAARAARRGDPSRPAGRRTRAEGPVQLHGAERRLHARRPDRGSRRRPRPLANAAGLRRAWAGFACQLVAQSGSGLPLPRRRTFAAPIPGLRSLGLQALRHPWLRWSSRRLNGYGAAPRLPL